MIDHEYTREPVCPYCGKEQMDSFEMPEDGSTECGECGKGFTFTSYISRTFTTKKCDCMNGDAPHTWVDYGRYKVCKTCDKREFVK